MYKKLLSNLPFNPSLIGEVSFYAERVNKEGRVRTIGIFFITLAFIAQLFAVVIQPEPSLASSRNDVIPGGFSSKAEAVTHCRDNNYDFRDTLEHFGVSCDALAASERQSIRSTDYDEKLLSLGRLPYGKAGETEVKINGKTYYQRYLWSWDSWEYSTYDALVGTRDNGTPFVVLYNCGNITVVDSPEPPPPPPPPPPPQPTAQPAVICGNIRMSVVDRATITTGTSVQVFGTASGSSIGSSDSVDMTYSAVDKDTGQEYDSKTRSAISFDGQIAEDSNGHSIRFSEPGTYNINLSVVFNGDEVDGSNEGSCQTLVYVKLPDLCPQMPGVQTDESECRPCDEASSNDDVTACLILSKSAENVTQKIAEADGTTAQPGDVITYSLTARNTATVPVDFAIEEHMGDVLEYALITDFHGGSIDDDAIVSWPERTIDPEARISERITIQILDELPNTPIPDSNPGSYDLTLTNVYGNTVEIYLPMSPMKTTEQVVRTLPDTGPGQSFIIAASVTTFVGYFFARTKLYNKELGIIKNDFASHGGPA